MGKEGKGAGATVNSQCGVGRQQEDFTIISSPNLPFLGRERGEKERSGSVPSSGEGEELWTSRFGAPSLLPPTRPSNTNAFRGDFYPLP